MNSYATEDQFRKHFELTCQALNAQFVVIPDVHKGAYAQNRNVPALKRPCDGVFDCVQGMAFIELKIQNGHCSPHQRKFLESCKSGQAYVLRAKETQKKGLVYTLETPNETPIYETKELREIVKQLAGMIMEEKCLRKDR